MEPIEINRAARITERAARERKAREAADRIAYHYARTYGAEFADLARRSSHDSFDL